MDKKNYQKKFLLFTLEYPPFKGGTSKYYENLFKYWPTKDLSVLVNSKKRGDDSEEVKHRPLINGYLRPCWLPALWHLWKECKNSHVIIGQILPLGIVAYYLSKIFKFKYSIILHGLDFSLASRKKITKKILIRAEKIICANNYTANLVKVFDNSLTKKMIMVNPGIELVFTRNPQKVKELKEKYNLENKIVLLSVGRLIKRKGVDKVLESLPKITATIPNLIYVIGGIGEDEKYLKNKIKELPVEIQEKILFLGSLTDEEYWAWLEICNIFIMPSRNITGNFEGFGIVYLEANLVGKPVIAGDTGGIRDAVINEVNGLLVNPEDNESIAKAVIRLSLDEKLRGELGEQGKRRVVENFGAKKQIKKIADFLTN